jgi:hypothetical protein
MAVKKGDGLLMVYSDVPTELDAEYNRWYNEEHMRQLLSIPGVLSAARYEAVSGGPKYLASYELASTAVCESDAWQEMLNNPTEWSRRMSPRVIGTAYINNLYHRIYPQELSEETAQAEMSPVILCGRMSVPEEIDAQFNDAYNHERLPECLKIPGYLRNRRFEAVRGEPRYTTVHEMESIEVWKSEGWDRWRTMETPVWNSLIRGQMVHAEGSPAVFRRIFPA